MNTGWALDVHILAGNPDNDPSLRRMFLVCLFGPRMSKIKGDAFETRDRSTHGDIQAQTHGHTDIVSDCIILYHVVIYCIIIPQPVSPIELGHLGAV